MKEMTKAKEIRDAEIASLVEHEVRKRLTWRMILLTLSHLPLVLLLIYFLYCYVQMRFFTAEYLQKRYFDVERRLRALEQKLNVDNHSKVTNSCHSASYGLDK